MATHRVRLHVSLLIMPYHFDRDKTTSRSPSETRFLFLIALQYYKFFIILN